MVRKDDITERYFPPGVMSSFWIVLDGCLEYGIIIVEDVDAEWSRGEEGESLDQSLCLEENPCSLQK